MTTLVWSVASILNSSGDFSAISSRISCLKFAVSHFGVHCDVVPMILVSSVIVAVLVIVVVWVIVIVLMDAVDP